MDAVIAKKKQEKKKQRVSEESVCVFCGCYAPLRICARCHQELDEQQDRGRALS